MTNLAVTYRHQGKTMEAAALLEQVWEKRSQIQGYHHPDTLIVMEYLHDAYDSINEFETMTI